MVYTFPHPSAILPPTPTSILNECPTALIPHIPSSDLKHINRLDIPFNLNTHTRMVWWGDTGKDILVCNVTPSSQK